MKSAETETIDFIFEEFKNIFKNDNSKRQIILAAIRAGTFLEQYSFSGTISINMKCNTGGICHVSTTTKLEREI